MVRSDCDCIISKNVSKHPGLYLPLTKIDPFHRLGQFLFEPSLWQQHRSRSQPANVPFADGVVVTCVVSTCGGSDGATSGDTSMPSISGKVGKSKQSHSPPGAGLSAVAFGP